MRIFVSSTFRDLKAHRDEVNRVLARMKVQYAAMEHFGSRTDEALPVCASEIDQCDLFVGIYAWRYGWTPPNEHVSITEAEFDRARSRGLPCLCYAVDENHPWPPPLIDAAGSDDRRRLDAFKVRVGALVRSTFTTPENLASQVAADLVRELARLGQEPAPSPPTPDQRWRRYCLRLADELAKDVESTDNYVDLLATEAGTSVDLQRRVADWLDDPQARMLAILGDFGGGKTTFCRHTCRALASARADTPDSFLPILLSLRNYRSTATLFDMLAAELRRLGGTIDDLSSAGKVVLFLDGLDEQAERFSDQETSRRLLEVQGAAPAEGKLVLTCRTHFFRDSVAESALLTTAHPFSTGLPLGRRPKVNVVYVAPFTQGQTIAYLQKALPTSWQEAEQTIESIYDLRDLASRPILLNLITKLLPDLRGLEGAVGQARLYQIAVDSWLERERWRAVPLEDVHRFLEEIAFAMIRNGRQSESIHFRSLAQHVRHHFQSRILSAIDLDAWDGMVRTSLFLNRDSEGNYSFMHRSFQEYFIAHKILRDARDRTYNDINSLPDLYRFSPETYQFARSLIPADETVNLYLMLSADSFPRVNWIAADILREASWPVPFDADSRVFLDVLKVFAGTDNRVIADECVRVMMAVKSPKALPALLGFFYAHEGDVSAKLVLDAIVTCSDSTALALLQELRARVARSVEVLSSRNLQEVKQRISEKHAHRRSVIDDFDRLRQLGRLDEVLPNTVLIAALGDAREHMWGVSCKEIDDAIDKLRRSQN